jgi:hypothetical protein
MMLVNVEPHSNEIPKDFGYILGIPKEHLMVYHADTIACSKE